MPYGVRGCSYLKWRRHFWGASRGVDGDIFFSQKTADVGSLMNFFSFQIMTFRMDWKLGQWDKENQNICRCRASFNTLLMENVKTKLADGSWWREIHMQAGNYQKVIFFCKVLTPFSIVSWLLIKNAHMGQRRKFPRQSLFDFADDRCFIMSLFGRYRRVTGSNRPLFVKLME